MPNEMEAALHDLAQETLGEWLGGYDLPGYKVTRTKHDVYEVTSMPYAIDNYHGKFKVTIHVEELGG